MGMTIITTKSIITNLPVKKLPGLTGYSWKEKRPVQVAIELNLREGQVNKFFREFWKLKRQYRNVSDVTKAAGLVE